MSKIMPLAGNRLVQFAAGTLLAVSLAACTSSASTPGTSPTPNTASSSPSHAPSATRTSAPVTPTSAPASTGASGTTRYRLHLDFFSDESGTSPAIDPQMFASAAGAKAGVGPQTIRHVAGIAPVRKTAGAKTPLFGADGKELGVTFGQWAEAAGTVRVSCVNSNERAVSTLTGLLPTGRYSTFAVHLDVRGAGRFTPWGNAAGTDNSFTASAKGTASPVDVVHGCLGTDTAIVIIWHSDGRTHGASPGTIGVTAHNSVIAQLP